MTVFFIGFMQFEYQIDQDDSAEARDKLHAVGLGGGLNVK